MVETEVDPKDSLNERAPTVDSLLRTLRSSTEYQAMVRDNRNLSKVDHNVLLYPSKMPWADLRMKIIESIVNNAATAKGQVAAKTKQHSKDCRSFWDEFSNEKPNCVLGLDGNTAKGIEWKCSAFTLSVDYTKALRHGICVGVHDMQGSVDKLLNESGKIPDDKSLAETMYHIASWLVFALKKGSKRRAGNLSANLKIVAERASMTREQAIAQKDLPTDKTQRQELYGGFTFATMNFFRLFLKLEHVYSSLLAPPENITICGTRLLCQIRECVVASEIGVNLDEFLPEETEDDDKEDLLQFVLLTFGHMRGKDFIRRKNAQVGPILTKAHRSEIAGKAKNASEKRKRKNKEEAKKKQKGEKKESEIDGDSCGGTNDVNDETADNSRGNTRGGTTNVQGYTSADRNTQGAMKEVQGDTRGGGDTRGATKDVQGDTRGGGDTGDVTKHIQHEHDTHGELCGIDGAVKRQEEEFDYSPDELYNKAYDDLEQLKETGTVRDDEAADSDDSDNDD